MCGHWAKTARTSGAAAERGSTMAAAPAARAATNPAPRGMEPWVIVERLQVEVELQQPIVDLARDLPDRSRGGEVGGERGRLGLDQRDEQAAPLRLRLRRDEQAAAGLRLTSHSPPS